MLLDLSVVMPVYNEEACIVDVVKSWYSMLSCLNINFRIIILNDGSTDDTAMALSTFKNYNQIEVINKKNTGHGPTILLGYKKAIKLAKWVFQCDSDNEMRANYFPDFWEKRENFDALIGTRKERKQNLNRKFISACSRIIVHLLFGKGISDVNTPFRLIRADILKQIVDQIPDNTFAPNVLISGVLSKAGLRIYEHPVPHISRKTGKVSIIKWKLWRSALKSFWQVLSCRPVINTIADAITRKNSLYN